MTINISNPPNVKDKPSKHELHKKLNKNKFINTGQFWSEGQNRMNQHLNGCKFYQNEMTKIFLVPP